MDLPAPGPLQGRWSWGLEPKSRRPRSNPRTLTQELRQEIIALRGELLSQGLDAGAASIAWHLKQKHQHCPALSTIWRILKAEALVRPQPKKRPRSYIQRFEAVQPIETWQSDFTHWRLSDGSDVEIINWLDDHSRLFLSCTVFKAITGAIVIDTFNEARSQYGTPFSTLTDNGNVYTARFVKGKMHHLGVGIENRFKKVYIVVDHYKVTVVEKKTGEIISQNEIQPTRTYLDKLLSG